MKETRSVEKTVRDLRRRTRKKYSSEEKIRIVLEGPRGEEVNLYFRLSYLLQPGQPGSRCPLDYPIHSRRFYVRYDA